MTAAPPSRPEEEDLYRQTCVALAQPDAPTRSRGKALLLLVTLVLFILLQFSMGSFLLAIVVGVLFLHEAGHLLAMRLFDYRDLRIFFIPFFGAAATGRKHAAPAWQQAVVLMSGPLIGIVLAGILYGLFTPPLDGRTIVSEAINFLVLVNAFNLLPLVPLDGGRLLNLLIFSRRPLLESSFLLFGGVVLFAVAWVTHFWVLYVVAAIVVLAVPFRYRKAGRNAGMREALPDLPARLEDLNEEQRHRLFHYVRSLDPECSDPTACASRVKAVHEEALARPPSIWASAKLLGLYVAGIVSCILIVYLDEGSTLGLEARVRQVINERIASGSIDARPFVKVSLTRVSMGAYGGTARAVYGGTARAVDGTSYTLEVSVDPKGHSYGYGYSVLNHEGQMLGAGAGACRLSVR